MTHFEVTDRYEATGYPDPKTVCQGHCEGTGCVPVYVSRGDYRIGPWTRPDDETDKALRAQWFAADEKDRCKDGWHFVECPDCGGTGKLTKVKPSMIWRLRIYEFLALPAHAWLWLCARCVGGQFKCGPVDDPDDLLE